MDEVIWIEVLGRHREVAARHRVGASEVRIGRGYDNDVVIDDPYVAAQHLVIRRDEAGALAAYDIGSANGTFVEPGGRRVETVVLDGDSVLRIGHTQLRVRDPRYSVARERASERPRPVWPSAVALAVAIIAIELVSLWLKETDEAKFSRYLQPPVILAGVVLSWTAVWAILSRIFAGQARFERNVRIALVGMLAYSLYNEAAEYLGFALTWRALAAYEYVAFWCLLAAICFFHLREIGPTHLRLKGGAVAALLVVGVGMQTLSQSELRTDVGQMNVSRRVLPPMLRLAPVSEEGRFFADVERLRDKLDHDRAETPTGASAGDTGD
ncbi:MAG TPA: FHA domain-containing protein [Stellaceae bacterium]|nr:FHA domain-containing protein [Stellaceae bacterium]